MRHSPAPALYPPVPTHRPILAQALTSAFVVRQGLGEDWTRIPMPRILLWNTAVLLASSIALESARKTREGKWLTVTLALGLLFLAGQMVGWRQLFGLGVYLSTNPHSSFFYVLTGVHALHLAGGLLSLAWVRLMREGDRRRARWLDSTALYWHGMDILWIYLLLLLLRS